MSSHIKIHILSNKKTIEMLGSGNMNDKIFEQIRLDTGVSRTNHIAIIRPDYDVVYIIEGHTSPEDVYSLLKRDDIPFDLRCNLRATKAMPRLRQQYQWTDDYSELNRE